MKYFRNKHLPATWYKAAGGNPLPSDGIPREIVFGLTLTILEYWCKYYAKIIRMKLITNNISKIINDPRITNIAIQLLSRLDPIAAAFDRAQRDGSTQYGFNIRGSCNMAPPRKGL